MKNRILGTILAVATSVFFIYCPLHAQKPAASAPDTQTKPDVPQESAPHPGTVVIEGRGPILTVFDTIAGATPEQRALGIEQRIVAAAKDRKITDTTATLESHPGWTAILVGDNLILAVTDFDAKMAGKKRDVLSAQYGQSVSRAIDDYRQDHSWRIILEAVGKALLTTFLLFSVLWLIRRVRFAMRGRIARRLEASKHREHRPFWRFAKTYLIPFVLAVGAIVRWALILIFVQAYFSVTLGFFSSTREISLSINSWVAAQLGALTKTTADYLPNLIVVAVIALVAHYLFRLSHLIFGEIAKGELKIRGFYPDWAEPTEKLLRVLILALTIVVAFPYLPGAKSPAFQGISIFLGVLLSLGSSSAVSNAIAGIILTYMRSFLVGDWVQIGDVMGEVTEKTILVTRVLTPKAEIITIPNSTVMSGSVKNFSVEAKHFGVIFHTTVTIGYDAPWRKVHELLIDAALATDKILKQPHPFVLQTNLQDFYIAYELNAYTDAPNKMVFIYSELHQNIQDKFNEAGMEICSPHFAAVRDGNSIAIPEQYHAPGYEAPGFRIDPVDLAEPDKARQAEAGS